MAFKYILTTTLLLATAQAMTYSLWDNDGCHGMPVKAGFIGPREGCQKRGDTVAVAAGTEDGNEADASSYAVFFKSDDCNPETMLGKSDSGCSTRNDIPEDFGSWEVWDMCEGQVGCVL